MRTLFLKIIIISKKKVLLIQYKINKKLKIIIILKGIKSWIIKNYATWKG